MRQFDLTVLLPVMEDQMSRRHGWEILVAGIVLGLTSSCRSTALRADRTATPVVAEVSAPDATPAEAVTSDLSVGQTEETDIPKVEPASGEILAPTDELNLPALEQLALTHNPAIRQANASVAKAAGFRDQVGTYPNPVVGYNGTQLADQGTDQHVGFVEQDIVLGKKLQRNRLVLEQEVQAQLWQVEITRYRVLTDVRSRFYETLAAQKRLKLATDFGNVTDKGVLIANQRLKALEGSRPELLQAQIQNNEANLMRERAEIQFRGAWTRLFAALGVPCFDRRPIVGSLRIPTTARDWDAEYCELETHSPEIRMACARVARAQVNLDRQRVQPIPNLSLMVAAGRDNGTGSEMINTQIGVPVPFFNRNEGNENAAWAEYCRATQEMERLKLSLRSRLATAAQDYDAAAVQVTTYENEILPQAQEALELSEQAYAAGEFDFIQVLVVRRTFFESNLQAISAQGEFAQAHALIEGMLLSNSLDESTDADADDSLRGQTLSGQ